MTPCLGFFVTCLGTAWHCSCTDLSWIPTLVRMVMELISFICKLFAWLENGGTCCKKTFRTLSSHICFNNFSYWLLHNPFWLPYETLQQTCYKEQVTKTMWFFFLIYSRVGQTPPEQNGTHDSNCPLFKMSSSWRFTHFFHHWPWFFFHKMSVHRWYMGGVKESMIILCFNGTYQDSVLTKCY